MLVIQKLKQFASYKFICTFDFFSLFFFNFFSKINFNFESIVCMPITKHVNHENQFKHFCLKIVNLQAAVMAKDSGQIARAVSLLLRALQVNESHEPTLSLFTLLVQQEQKTDLYVEAHRRMQTLLSLKPFDPELEFRNAMLSWRLLHWLQTSGNNNHHLPDASDSFVKHLERQTEASLMQVLRLQPNQEEALFNLALLKYRQQRLTESLDVLRTLLKIQPEHSKGRVLWCACLKMVGDTKQNRINQTSLERLCVDV